MQQFFAQSGITIDSDFARFGTKSFSVGKITSIDVRSTRPGELAGGVLIAIGVLVSIFGLLALLTGTFVLSVVLAIGVPLLIYGVQLANERAFLLVIVSAGGEHGAFRSANHELVEEMRAALEAAMTQSNLER